MRKILSFRLMFIIFPFIYTSALAQPDHFAYAVTSVSKGGTEWVAFRKLDTRTGEFSSILLNMQEKSLNTIDLSSIKPLAINAGTNMRSAATTQASFGNSVAAIAYDRKNNRLYYSPMSIDQLRYIDLSTMQVVSTLNQSFSKIGKYDAKNAGPINRMVIAPDNFGYSITNDGTHMFRFTTNGSPVLTDLGELIDDPLNKENTIVNNPCANSGGDLIADDQGHLYLITGTNRVFKVDISTRKTTYQATISGLPQKFTTSGAAINEDGKLVISSATYSDAYFIVDPENWNASPSMTLHEIYETADLANSNTLHSNSTDNSNLFLSKNPDRNNQIRVFPNPVLFDEVNVQFNDLPAGNYTIQLANVLGKKMIQQKIMINGATQTETLRIPHFAPQGFYYIHILDENKKVVSTQKLVVERW